MSYTEFLKANDTKELLWMRQKWTDDLKAEKRIILNTTQHADRLEELLKLINGELKERGVK